MDKREFYEVTDELATLVEYGGELEPACAQCPYAKQCKAQGLYYGCGAWEQAMGDDL